MNKDIPANQTQAQGNKPQNGQQNPVHKKNQPHQNRGQQGGQQAKKNNGPKDKKKNVPRKKGSAFSRLPLEAKLAYGIIMVPIAPAAYFQNEKYFIFSLIAIAALVVILVWDILVRIGKSFGKKRKHPAPNHRKGKPAKAHG